MKSSTEAPAIPAKMKRLVLVGANKELEKAQFEVRECDVPVPENGQVLVRVVAAPVNPSDYHNWMHAPNQMGNEGSGIVVASGGGLKANGLLGAKVGIANLYGQLIKDGGSYQEYVCISASEGCFPLPDDCPVEDGCSFFVNPFTAVAMIEAVREIKSPGFVHTAAASQLGQMLVKLCTQEDMTLINVVRRDDQAEILKALGAEHVFVSSKEGWKDELKALVKEKGISCAFDCVSGQSPGDMVNVLPSAGIMYAYGNVSGEPIRGSDSMVADMIYKKKKVESWGLMDWLKCKEAADGVLHQVSPAINRLARCALPAVFSGWSSSQFVDVAPEEMFSKLMEMRKGGGFTNKKLRIRWPQPEPAASEASADTEPAAKRAR